MARRGNTSLSSLLRTAESARDRQNAYNDSVAGYEFSLSDHSSEAFQRYQSYLQGRIKDTTDPGKALTLQKTITSAQRTFTSAEIGRSTLDVLYGNSDNTHKLGVLQNLFTQAQANGDDALASSIEEKYARLTQTIASEQEAAANRAEAAGRRAEAQTQKGYRDQLGEINYALAKYKADLKNGQLGSQDYQLKASQALQHKEAILKDASKNAPDPGSFQTQLEQLKGSEEFQKLASPAIVDRLGRKEIPYSVKIDPRTGEPKFDNLTITGRQAIKDDNGKVALDANGRPLIANSYDVNASPQVISQALKNLGFDSSKFKDNTFTYKRVDPLNGQEHFATAELLVDNLDKPTYAYYIDPETGQKIQIDAKGNRSPFLNGNEPPLGNYKSPFKEALKGASYRGNSASINVVSPAQAKSNYLADIEAKRQALAAEQLAARTQYNSGIVQQISQAPVGAPATFKQPLNPPSQPYQSFNNAPADRVVFPNPSNNAQVATNLGAAAGLNPNFLINGTQSQPTRQPVEAPKLNFFQKAKSFLGF